MQKPNLKEENDKTIVKKNINNLKEKRQVIERIEKLEICMVLLINQLNNVEGVPKGLLKNIESILLKGR